VKQTWLQRIAASLVSRPAIYDLVQRAAGQEIVSRRLRAATQRLPPALCLDVGGSSGGFARRLGTETVCLDVDVRPLLALKRADPSARALAGDGAQLPFPAGTFQRTLCVMVFHHVDDATLPGLVAELSRVTSGHLVFLEPLVNPRRAISRFLWKYDRGRHPRDRAGLLAALSAGFVVEETTEFSVYHQYLLAIARPREGRSVGPA
jgi:ubiquinone/menaquinone biosynthesis C-methylase UbiE